MKKNTATIFFSIILMDLLTGMEFDLFVPSFTQIQHDFHLTAFWVEALLSVNFIGYCLSLFFVGGLADRYGRKCIILLGLSTFVVGSVLCLSERAFYFLLIGRFLQGIGIAAPAVLSFLIIADTYPIKEQRFLMAMLNGVMNTAVAIAPVFGSYIALYFHWQGNFFTLLMLGIVTLLASLFFIPSYHLPKHPSDILPNNYRHLFQSKPLMLLIVMLFINYVPYWIFVGTSPLLFIKELGVSLHYFGFYQGSLALSYAIVSILYGFMIRNRDYQQKNMLFLGNGIFIVSLLMMLILSIINTKSPLLITIAMLFFVLGQIIPGALLTPLALNFMSHAKARVSALLQAGRLILTSFSVQIAGFFYTGSFQNIGFIIATYIFLTVILLFFVINNKALMQWEHS